LRLLHGAGAVVSQWAADRLGYERGFGPSEAIGILDGEALIGAVVFHNWAPEGGVVEMSAFAADPRWLSKTVLRTVFRYAFDALGCQMVVWRVAPSNNRTCRLAHRLGFISHRIPRLRGRNEDEFIFTLTDDAWRAGPYERSEHGQVSA
jgi:RimJ/RimL family protein N-acetyltransferase